MLLDPGFAQDARQRLDTILGHFSVSEHTNSFTLGALSEIREDYLRLLTMAEQLARLPITSQSALVPRSKSIRRRIFEWFERG